MKKPNVEEVLQQGIHGPLETKPEERRRYLGTLRERIIVALTKKQVAETQAYPQIEEQIKKYNKSHLLLNGSMAYSDLSKYVKMATAHKIEHTIVRNKEHDTEIGLVLAVSYAIEKEEIYVTKEDEELPKTPKPKGILAKLFKRTLKKR